MYEFVLLSTITRDWFNYQMHPRAYIFRRDAVKVNDLAAARNLLRYNNWKNDPAAYGTKLDFFPCRQPIIITNRQSGQSDIVAL